MKLVLLDIDGTILNTDGAGRRAISRALLDVLLLDAVSPEYRFDGKTDPQIVSDLLRMAGHPGAEDSTEINRVCTEYVALLEGELTAGGARTRLFPGVLELLSRLEEETGTTPGLLTGNVEAGARLKLAAAGVSADRFPVGAFGSDSPDRRQLPAVAKHRGEAYLGRALRFEDLVVIGDTPADVACALHAGSRAVAVSTGSYDASRLRDAGAHVVFESLTDTDAVLDAILA